MTIGIVLLAATAACTPTQGPIATSTSAFGRHQFGCVGKNRSSFLLDRPKFDQPITTLTEPELPQFIEHGRIAGGHATGDAGILWSGTKNPDAHHSIRVLRTCHTRPRHRRAAQQER